jgi:hypothetical protein
MFAKLKSHGFLSGQSSSSNTSSSNASTNANVVTAATSSTVQPSIAHHSHAHLLQQQLLPSDSNASASSTQQPVVATKAITSGLGSTQAQYMTSGPMPFQPQQYHPSHSSPHTTPQHQAHQAHHHQQQQQQQQHQQQQQQQSHHHQHHPHHHQPSMHVNVATISGSQVPNPANNVATGSGGVTGSSTAAVSLSAHTSRNNSPAPATFCSFGTGSGHMLPMSAPLSASIGLMGSTGSAMQQATGMSPSIASQSSSQSAAAAASMSQSSPSPLPAGLPPNPISQHFEIGTLIGSAGPELAWRVYSAVRRCDRMSGKPFTDIYI